MHSDEMHKAAAITADTLTWQEMSAKASGVMIATVSGDYTQGAWASFVRFPAGSKSGVHTHSSDLKIVEMVWIGGDLLYGRESIVGNIKPNQCEALDGNGAAKRICAADTRNPVPKASQTLAQIRLILLDKYPHLAALVR